MEKTVEKICIVCPAGCHLAIREENGNYIVEGNTCPRGKKYGENEMRDPRRVVTFAVRTDSPQMPCIPVKSSAPLPRGLIEELLTELKKCRISLPVKRGDVLLKDFRSTGIDIIFTGECV